MFDYWMRAGRPEIQRIGLAMFVMAAALESVRVPRGIDYLDAAIAQ